MGKKSKTTSGTETPSPLKETPVPVDRSKNKPAQNTDAQKSAKNTQNKASSPQKTSKAKEETKPSSKTTEVKSSPVKSQKKSPLVDEPVSPAKKTSKVVSEASDEVKSSPKKQKLQKPSSKVTSSPEKKQKPTQSAQYSASGSNKKWLQENWKMVALVATLLGVITFTKLAEETFGRYNVRSGNQVEEDLYELVGSGKSSSFDEIKASYKQKALELHPDRNPDCKDCQEKFAKVSKAYEVLINPESRRYYDRTNSILKIIKSTAENLNSDNFQSLVEDSSDIWIIMVYQDTDETSRTFTGFFDEVAQQFPFIKFGRINYASEQSLIARLPFKVQEIPFFLSWDKYGNSDFLEFDFDRDAKGPLTKFVRQALGKHYALPGISSIKSELANQKSSKPSVIFINRSWMPLSFSYLAYKFGSEMNVWSTNFGEHKEIYKQIKQDTTDYVVVLPGTLKHNDKNYFTLKFDGAQLKNEATHLNVFNLAKFLTIPDLGRSSFNEFCNGGSTQEEQGKIIVCVVALKRGSDEAFKGSINSFVEEQNNILPKFVSQIEKNESELFDGAKSVQFGVIDLNVNKAFANVLASKVSVQNPKIMIYLSGQKKVAFYNNVDDAFDVMEDIKAGEIDGFKHWKVVSETDELLAHFLKPDNAGFFSLVLKSVKRQFSSFMNITFVIAGIFLGKSYAGQEYQTSAVGAVGLLFVVSLLIAVKEALRIGLF